MLPLTSYAWGSPGRYIQGAGELDRLAIHTEKFGKRAFAVIDEFFYKSFTKSLDTLYKDAGGAFLSFLYQTEIIQKSLLKKHLTRPVAFPRMSSSESVEEKHWIPPKP